MMARKQRESAHTALGRLDQELASAKEALAGAQDTANSAHAGIAAAKDRIRDAWGAGDEPAHSRRI